MSRIDWISVRLRALPPMVRAMLLGSLINRVGNGLVLPYTMIYLHNQRGATLTVSGLLVGLLGLIGLLMSYVAGEIVDKFGRARTVATSLLFSTVGYLIVGSPIPLWGITAGMLLAGLGNGLFWPAQKALLASSTAQEAIHVAFSLDEVAANLGIGIGGLTGAVLVSLAGQQHLGWLFTIDAATFAAFGFFLIPFVRADRLAATGTDDEHGTAAGRRPDMLDTLRRDTAFTYLMIVQVAVVICGFVALEQLPVYLKNFAGVGAGIVGLLFLTNVIANVLLQLRVTRWLEGRDRVRSLQAAMILWAAIWIAVAVGTALLRGPAAMAIAAICAGVFAVGEAIVAVIVDPLVGALAPKPMIGRYMGLLTTAWNAGLLVGPVLCGLIMQHAHGLLWPMLAGLLVVAATATTRVRTSLSPEQILVPQSSGT